MNLGTGPKRKASPPFYRSPLRVMPRGRRGEIVDAAAAEPCGMDPAASQLREVAMSLRVGIVTVCWLGFAVAGGARAAQVETFVLGVGGDASGPLCATWGTPLPVFQFFGGFGPAEPLGGYPGCGIAGGYDSQTAPAGWLADARADSFGWGINSITGSTDASVRHGEASARAAEAYAGQSHSFQAAGFEGFGRFDDTFVVTSPSIANGQTGWIRFHLSVTGDASLTAQGALGVEIPYYDGTLGPYTAWRMQATHPAANPWITSATGIGLAGFALSPGAIAGADVVPTLWHSFSFGAPRDWKFGLLTYASPSLGGAMDSAWHMKITGIEVLNAQGQPVGDFSIAAASGTGYGAGGVIDTPCANGLDDDGDGAIDFPADPGCFDATAASAENPKCQNGLDDDGDGTIDFDGGAAANGGVPLGPPDPQCTFAYRNKESPSSCGLGAELALLAAAGGTLRRARMRSGERRH